MTVKSKKTKVSQAIYEISHFACDVATADLQKYLSENDTDMNDGQRAILNTVVVSGIKSAFDKSIENISSQIENFYIPKKK